MRRRVAHCRCRPRPRYRVRRPIFGLVHGNYPPGLAATYHFIPKQTTLILYRLLRQIAIRFLSFLRNFFVFFFRSVSATHGAWRFSFFAVRTRFRAYPVFSAFRRFFPWKWLVLLFSPKIFSCFKAFRLIFCTPYRACPVASWHAARFLFPLS